MIIKNIKSEKETLKGEDIYILANAPSVKDNDLSLLKNKNVIGMNANPLLEEEFGFFSKFYVVSDMRFLSHPFKREMATKQLHPSTKRVFRKELKDIDDLAIKNETYYIDAIARDGFSTNLEKGYYFGCTTTMLCIQLAYYLGAKNIYILGMDLTYSGNTPRFYKEEIVQEFDSFTSVQIKNVRNAYLFLKEEGINLFNCSSKSLLFPYIPFISFEDTLG